MPANIEELSFANGNDNFKRIYGNSINNYIHSHDSAIINGGLGDDTIESGNVEYSSGQGNDTVLLSGQNGGLFPSYSFDNLSFLGINQSGISISQDNSTLMITVKSTGETITYENFEKSNTASACLNLDTITFADGTVLDVNYMMNTTEFVGTSGVDLMTRDGDTLRGGKGNDIYVTTDSIIEYSKGDGSDYIEGGGNTIRFDDIASTDVEYISTGFSTYNDYALKIKSTGDLIYLTSAISKVQFFDGVTWTNPTATSYFGSTASTGDDYLGAYSSSIVAGKGNDFIHDANNLHPIEYVYSKNDGNDIIQELSYGTTMEKIRFTDINSDDIRVTTFGHSAQIRIVSTGETITLLGQTNSYYGIDSIEFANGEVWNKSYIDSAAVAGTNVNDFITGLAVSKNDLNGYIGRDTLTGGSANDTLNGGQGVDRMVGLAGDDVYYVDNAKDVVVEAANGGFDTIYANGNYTLAANVEKVVVYGTTSRSIVGNAANNVLTGNAGNDTLNGGAGVDTMAGGLGNDVYYVNSVSDVVTEALNAGTDTVNSSASYTLTSNVERLTLLGTAAINGVGNALANILVGNSANNVLNGAAGNDKLIGNAGNDTLIGGLGLDSMLGGLGNDAYYVDNAGDVVTEALNQGVDSIYSSVTYSLGANQENLYLQGTLATNGVGNSSNNIIMGNANKNSINGGAGADNINAGAGNDILTGSLGNDVLRGGVGNDIYNVSRGDGADVISEIDATAGNIDVLNYRTGVNSNQLWFQHVGNDLVVTTIGTTDKVTVKDWYSGAANQVEQIKASDGKVLLNTEVAALVNAMAAFAIPAAGQTTLSSSVQSSLNPVFAANWS